MARNLPPKAAPSETAPPEPNATVSPDDPVSIPLDDVTIPDYADAVAEAIALRHKLAAEARDKQEIWSRSSEKKKGETDEEHQDRIKAEFEAAVLAVRKQEEAPPPPPQPVPAAITEQTKREMEMGAKTSAYWAEQQQHRPLPTAKEIQAAGSNTPVFRPGEYLHEKGGLDKNLVIQDQPVR
jgi:hypothetical protein